MQVKISALLVCLCALASGTALLGQCPGSVKGSKVPSTNWKATSAKAGYYAPDSAVINDGNGQVVAGQASYATVKSDMGGAFSSATFTLVGGAGSASNLPAGVVQCSYDGPRFKKGGSTLQATITINCKGASCSTF